MLSKPCAYVHIMAERFYTVNSVCVILLNLKYRLILIDRVIYLNLFLFMPGSPHAWTDEIESISWQNYAEFSQFNDQEVSKWSLKCWMVYLSLYLPSVGKGPWSGFCTSRSASLVISPATHATCAIYFSEIWYIMPLPVQPTILNLCHFWAHLC